MPALGQNMEDSFRGVCIQVADSSDLNVLDRDKDTRQIGARYKGATSKYGGTKGQNRAKRRGDFWELSAASCTGTSKFEVDVIFSENFQNPVLNPG